MANGEQDPGWQRLLNAHLSPAHQRFWLYSTFVGSVLLYAIVQLIVS